MKEFALVVTIVFVTVASIFGVFGCIAHKADYITASASIESVRADIENISVARSEDAVGLAVEWNQEIANKQRWNRVPFLNLWIPDGWDRIERIQIPE